jgi:hypothetical protein
MRQNSADIAKMRQGEWEGCRFRWNVELILEISQEAASIFSIQHPYFCSDINNEEGSIR